MSARMKFCAAMALAAFDLQQDRPRARGCPIAEEAMVHFLGMDAADRTKAEPHFASFLRLRLVAPREALAEAWAAYDALGAPRPAAKMLPGDWRLRPDAGLGL